MRAIDIPFRLLDFLGFVIPFSFLDAAADCLTVARLRVGGGGRRGGAGGGVEAGLMTGEERKADGEGIVIASILPGL